MSTKNIKHSPDPFEAPCHDEQPFRENWFIVFQRISLYAPSALRYHWNLPQIREVLATTMRLGKFEHCIIPYLKDDPSHSQNSPCHIFAHWDFLGHHVRDHLHVTLLHVDRVTQPALRLLHLVAAGLVHEHEALHLHHGGEEEQRQDSPGGLHEEGESHWAGPH